MTPQYEPRQDGVSRKTYDTPELTRLGDVEKITQDHAYPSCKDMPLGSSDDIKSSCH